LIQSSEKECTDLTGRSEHGHLVLVCAKSVQSAALLQVNRQRGCPAAQMGVAVRFSQMHWSRSDLIENAERFVRIDLDLSDFEKERNY